MTAQGLAIVAVGLAELNHMPPQQFTSYLLELFHKQLANASPSQAASFIWALPRLLLPLTHSQAAATAAAAADGDASASNVQQQQQGSAGSGAALPAGGWLRQYCWLLQVSAEYWQQQCKVVIFDVDIGIRTDKPITLSCTADTAVLLAPAGER
jgi:hypothetical protein